MRRVAIVGIIALAAAWWVLGEWPQSEIDTLPDQAQNAGIEELAPVDLVGDGDLPKSERAERTPSADTAAEIEEPPAEALSGSLSGQIVLASGEKVDRFEWTLRLEGPGLGWPMNEVKVQADGTFLATKLQAGIYTAVVEHERMPMARIDKLAVIAGERCLDPRLNPWYPELNSREMQVQISGRPEKLGNTNVWALNSESQILGHARRANGAYILQCEQGTAPDVLVIAPGFQPVRLPWQDGLVQVELDPGLEVELQTIKPVKYAEGIKRGWFSLRPETLVHGVSPAQFAVNFSAQDLAAGKPVKLRLPVATSYELRFDADKNDGPGFMPLYFTVIQHGLIVIDFDGVQQLEILLPDPLKTDDD